MTETLNLYAMGLVIATPLVLLFLFPTRVLRYLQRKRYQYEVTFSLYMMTPTEKFIFNSILFLLLAMVSIATALYLPRSISNVLGRGWWYILGDESHQRPLGGAAGGVSSISTSVGGEVGKSSAAAVTAVAEVSKSIAAAVAGATDKVAREAGRVVDEWYGHGSQNLHEL